MVDVLSVERLLKPARELPSFACAGSIPVFRPYGVST